MKLVSPEIDHYCQKDSQSISNNFKKSADQTQAEFESALTMAEVLPPGGEIMTCDIS